jgi:hypothetical protein
MTPDDLYNLIKNSESQIPFPAPYFTVDVGAFDASTGSFSGKTTTVRHDPEPVPHGPNQHPVQPQASYEGEFWVSIQIDENWQRTITQTPAPTVPLAPVMLKFSVVHPNGAGWSVTVNGTTVSAPASQASLSIDIWDYPIAQWEVSSGNQSYKDTIMPQRPQGSIGAQGAVGGFTLPVLPVAIVYAPPADSLGQSTASYGQAETIGATSTFDLKNDSATTGPDLDTEYSDLGTFKTFLDLMTKGVQEDSSDLSAAAASANSAGQTSAATDFASSASSAGVLLVVLQQISAAIGEASSETTNGITDITHEEMTAIVTTGNGLATSAKIGGPGVGDSLQLLTNVKVAWALYKGQLRLAPIWNGTLTVSAALMEQSPATTGLSPELIPLLLGLDPFVAGNGTGTLPPDRFELLERATSNTLVWAERLAEASTSAGATRGRVRFRRRMRPTRPNWTTGTPGRS